MTATASDDTGTRRALKPHRSMAKALAVALGLSLVVAFIVGIPVGATVSFSLQVSGGPVPTDPALRGARTSNGVLVIKRFGVEVRRVRVRQDRRQLVALRTGHYSIAVEGLDGCSTNFWVLHGGTKRVDVLCSVS
jgi:hypothetical protein